MRRSDRPHDAVLGWDDELGRWADASLNRSARVTPGVVFDGAVMTHVDAAGLDAIADLVRHLPVELYAARVKSPVRARLGDVIAEERFHPTVRAAVAAAVTAAEPRPARAPR